MAPKDSLLYKENIPAMAKERSKDTVFLSLISTNWSHHGPA